MWLWDNREHQYWRGNDGSFLPRHSDVFDQVVEQTEGPEGKGLRIGLSYLCQDGLTRQDWAFAAAVDDPPLIDCGLSIENTGSHARDGYSQFFASYHPGSDGALYLDRADVLREAPEYSLLEVSGAESLASDIDADWIRTPAMERIEGVAPILLSSAYWNRRWRHLMMFSPEVWALAAWRSRGSLFDFRALDYLVGPPGGNLPAGSGFTAQIRHLIVASDVTARAIRRHLDTWLESR
jgi:hypothetical protein